MTAAERWVAAVLILGMAWFTFASLFSDGEHGRRWLRLKTGRMLKDILEWLT